uniref:Uncharacterized protein n=1 Tax=Glossina palpalis gambiensis TaxID=67801 RepID=A0A1B0C5U6_9MUSC
MKWMREHLEKTVTVNNVFGQNEMIFFYRFVQSFEDVTSSVRKAAFIGSPSRVSATVARAVQKAYHYRTQKQRKINNKTYRISTGIHSKDGKFIKNNVSTEDD